MKASLLATLFVTLVMGQAHNALAQNSVSAAGIALDSAWKQSVYQFAVENLQHSAWGLQHYERNYLMATELARTDSLSIDEEVLFAAAFLHDMGTFAPYAVAGAEHSQTAVDNLTSVLIDAGFPSAKIAAVSTAVLAHMYYAEVPSDATATVLHDADTLDFLGVIGVTRILSLTSRHPWASDLQTALGTLESFSEELPAALRTNAAQEIGRIRVTQMRALLSTLREETVDGAAL